MKNLEAMTNKERQQEFRKRLAETESVRLSVTIGPDSVSALKVIREWQEQRDQPTTKRAAIEAALYYMDWLIKEEHI